MNKADQHSYDHERNGAHQNAAPIVPRSWQQDYGQASLLHPTKAVYSGSTSAAPPLANEVI